MKRCSVCKEHKARDEFSRHIRRKDGFRSACKECEKKTYKKQPRDKERDKRWEAEQLESLTDRVIKQAIWRETRGRVKGNDITPEMIEAKREEIRERRDKRETRIGEYYEGAHCLIHLVECDVCGRWLSSRWSTAKQCSDDCRYEKFKEYKRTQYKNGWEQPEPFKCKECGKIHQPEFGDKRSVFCSFTCQLRDERRRGKYSKSTFKRNEAERNGERFKPIDIYERDRWVCQLCYKGVNRRIKYPHPLSATQDHIIPIALGGTHTKDNIQLAHLRCNVSAGIGGIKQLRLF